MAIGVDGIFLSMVSPESGEYLTANVYTVDGVYEADGVTLRRLSIGQLVMAICLQRASQLEVGYSDKTTGKHVDGIIDMMSDIELASEQLELMTKIENEVLDHNVNLAKSTLTYNGRTWTYYNFLDTIMELDTIPSTANKDSAEFLTSLEAKMDQKNSFSQQTMIELQSFTNKRDQAYDMVSNVLKSINTTLIGNVNNM